MLNVLGLFCYTVLLFSIFMLEHLFLDTILLTAHSGIVEPVRTSIWHLWLPTILAFAWIIQNWQAMLPYDKCRGSILTLLFQSLFKPTCGASADTTGPVTLLKTVTPLWRDYRSSVSRPGLTRWVRSTTASPLCSILQWLDFWCMKYCL